MGRDAVTTAASNLTSRWLAGRRRSGTLLPVTASATLSSLEPACSLDDALALFDALEPVRCEDLTGRWRGRELATGHPMDGLLSATGWYGKRFDRVDAVHPLLYRTPAGEIVSVDPRRAPLSGDPAHPGIEDPATHTDKPRARLRAIEYRGVVTAAMVYDHLPIIDAFRRVDDDTLLGAMDLRSVPAPYLFVLARD